jgi:hypothetical protein
MRFEPWHLAAMEDNGYGTTNEALVNRVANYLAEYGSDNIGNDEFISACHACNVDPYSFTEQDLFQLKQTLKNGG